jgi:hypothetical protein
MLTRREFVMAIAAGGAFAAMPTAMCPPALAAPAPVVSIHMDQPYIDLTGRAKPYQPPNGLCSAAPIEHLSEQQIRSHHPYL